MLTNVRKTNVEAVRVALYASEIQIVAWYSEDMTQQKSFAYSIPFEIFRVSHYTPEGGYISQEFNDDVNAVEYYNSLFIE